MPARAKTFHYGVTLEHDWTGRSSEGGGPLAREDAWSPEHLLLAGLGRCTLTSLRYHARRAGIDDESRAALEASVTRRESDGRYAFVDIAVRVEATLAPPPTDVSELLAKAERDCFVGASLTAPPAYTWIVNGEEVR